MYSKYGHAPSPAAYRSIATGEIGKVQGKETAFEQAAIFEFFCHLAIERCDGAHEALRLRVSNAACFFLGMLGAFQKALSSKTEIHNATHSNSRMLVRLSSTGSKEPLAFMSIS